MLDFEGVAPPLVTPFDGEDIDESSYFDMIDWLLSNGVNGLVPCGSNGEVAYLSNEERIKVINLAVQGVDGRVPVIAGTGANTTSRTIGLTEAARKAGADAALVVTPFYYPLSQNQLVSHYKTVADEVDIPIILYNVPKFTHQNLEVDSVIELSKISNIVGIKESSGDFGALQELIANTKEKEFSVIIGSGNLFASALKAGAQGAVLALSNIAPRKCSQIFEAHREGNWEKAKEMNYKLLDLNRAVTTRFGIPGLKDALNMRGIYAGQPRPPLQSLNKNEKRELRKILEKNYDL